MSTIVRSHSSSTGALIIDESSSDAAPGVNDDTTFGHIVGSTWKVLNSDGLVSAEYVCLDKTNAAAVWRRLATEEDGRKILFIDEAIEFTADAAINMTKTLPANCVPLFGVLNCDSLLVLSTAVKVGLGTAADPDGYALSSATVTKNTKSRGKGALCDTRVTGETTVALTACDTGGSAAGTVTSGTVHARVYYAVFSDIPDAA